MTRRSSIALSLVLVGFVLGVGGLAVWVLRGSSGALEAQAVAVGSPERVPPSGVMPELTAPAPDEVTAPDTLSGSAPSGKRTSPPSGRLAAEQVELTNAYWIEGRVIFPDGTPLGEHLEVVARGKPFENRPLHRAEVRSDGSFRVAFSLETRTGWLLLEADHLYLDKPLRVKPKKPPSNIELHAKLGGRIAGVVVAPPLSAEDHAELISTELELEGREPDVLTDLGHKRKAELDEGLAFAFGGLPTGLDYQVALDSDVLTRAELDGLTVQPGETTEIELEATLGVRVSGRVLDAEGNPIDGAELHTFSKDDSAERRSPRPNEVELEENGSFLARGVKPGEIAVVARAEGYFGEREDLGPRADGDRAEGVQLVLGRGHFVRGHVQWPDGERVSECTIALSQDVEEADSVPFEIRSRYLARDNVETETSLDGTFEITGLGPGPYAIDASAVRPDESGKRRKKGPRWNAQLEDLASDTEGLVITLGQGLSISGRVVDDAGALLDRFVVQAMPANENNAFLVGGNWWFNAEQGLSQKFRDAGGLFTLDGFRAGHWMVRATAEDHQDASPVAVELPGEGASLELTVPRVAVVSGVVLDPLGNPVDGAGVSVAPEGGPVWMSLLDKHGARTDETGAFEVDDAPTGRVSVSAKARGFAPSADQSFDLRPGDSLTGVALKLRRGGRITGLLLSTHGEPVAGRKIQVDVGQWSLLDRSTRTDEAGAFVFENLPPGTYGVNASLSDEERRALERDQDQAAKWSAQKHATVVVEDDETVHVVLGAASDNAILVTGVITRSGEPVDAAQVWVSPVGSRGRQQSRSASTAADGSYELVLDGPGEYAFSVSGEQRTQRSHIETIPDAETHRVDIDLPAGSIAGRVFGPDGEPLEEVAVTLSASEAIAETRSFGVSGWQQTEEDGSFRFEGVAPGEYVITGGNSLWGRSAESEYGTAVAEVTVVDGEVREGLELHVERAAIITGTVLDPDGRPVSGASIFVRNESGALLEQWSMVVTDGAGRFRRTGLNSGTWTVSARRGRTASAESRPIRLSAGGKAHVQLELELSTMLVILTEDENGNPVGASLSVTDAAGREYRSMNALVDQNVQEKYKEGLARVAGPLPPGKYRVVVSNHDGVSSEQEVKLSGEERREVRLRLGEAN